MPDTPRHPSAGTAAESSHLSIGEVLGLLLEEFPDVTISKIRFLESQGLIAPERTPSGYRKFFDEDVDLLRVILREQRENYLPLRVIKDRISTGELDPSGENTIPRGIRNVASTSSDDANDAADDSDGGSDDTQPVGIPRTLRDAPSRTQAGEDDRASTQRSPAALDTAPIPTVERDRPSAASAPPPAERSQPRTSPPPSRTEPSPAATPAPREETPMVEQASDKPTPYDRERADDSGPHTGATEATAPSTLGDRPPADEREQRSRSPSPSQPTAPSEASEPPRPAATPADEESPGAVPASAPPPTSSSTPAPAPPQLLPGVTLTADELCAMVGATGEEIHQLEEYGIIAGRDSAGEYVYDENAVTVARIAVQFLHLGVDARHLRGWRTSADREAGIYEQLITPLLRQRNPQGRQQATEQLQRMNELGAELRAALMRIALSGLDRH